MFLNTIEAAWDWIDGGLQRLAKPKSGRAEEPDRRLTDDIAIAS